MTTTNYHKSVLLKEAVDGLRVEIGKKYIDATFGGGGHSSEIILRGGKVLGIDLDDAAIEAGRDAFKEEIDTSSLTLVRGNFSDIEDIASRIGFEKVSGILFDLGLSSNQIEDSKRGFSYLRNGPLDMRMDRNLQVTAADLLKVLGKGELYEIFNKFGQENNAHAISNGIVSARRVKEIETTNDLMDILKSIYKFKGDSNFMRAKIGRKVFQALRMAVNDELGNLKEGLSASIPLLESKGRICVITFHSLEDRIVKQAFDAFEASGRGIFITKKPILPSYLEIKENSRSKSAKLRIFEKV